MRLPVTTNFNNPNALALTSKSPFAILDGEPVLIELQGEIQTDVDLTPEQLAGQTLGQLDTSNPNKPTLQISHHLLVGTIVTLQTPLAVLKHQFYPSDPTQDAGDPDTDGEERPLKRSKLQASSSPDTFARYADKTPSKAFKGRTLFPTSETAEPITSSPLRMPATPISVKVLETGKHEVIGLIRKVIKFSKRPEPVVHIEAPASTAATQ